MWTGRQFLQHYIMSLNYVLAPGKSASFSSITRVPRVMSSAAENVAIFSVHLFTYVNIGCFNSVKFWLCRV